MLNPAWLDAAYMTYGYADYFRHQAAAQAAQVHHPALAKSSASSVSPNPNPAAVPVSTSSSSAVVQPAEYPHPPTAGQGATMMPSPPGAAPATPYAMPQFPFNHVAAAAAAKVATATPHAFHPYNFAAAAGLRARNAALHHHPSEPVVSHVSPASSRPSSSSPTQQHVLLKLNTSIETSSIHEQSASDGDSDDEQIDVVKSEFDLDKSLDVAPLRMRCDLKAPSAMKPLYHESGPGAVVHGRQSSPETTTKIKSAAVQQKTVWRPY